ncbi:MAG: carnitine-CoA ligase [Solirubrobacteraceae bacterium]|nr:carnitine-CoA ligase [Solirubrobacteraceae bacterium]
MAATTIPELFEAAVEDTPDGVWLRADGGEWTYAQARERVLGAAAGLAELGGDPGELVLATMRNTPEHLFAWLGAMYRGAIFVPVNPKLSEAERSGLVDQVAPQVVLQDAEVAQLAERASDEGAATAPDPDAPAILIPTSGTTGRSKLVTQTQRAYAMAAEGFPFWMELDGSDRLMTSLPLFHINAPAYSVLGSVAARAGLVLLESFSASTFIESARRHGATEFNAIGAMIEILMRRPERPDDASGPLRLCYTGPSPSRERQLEIERRFGLRLVCGYALSESPYGMIWARGTRPYGTLGSPRQHPELGDINEARVVDGELQLRNPVVMKGYWGMPEETERVLLDDGWLRTGDLVVANDDGTYTFVGREKDVIRRRGENLAPVEVEDVLMAHPGVAEAAVVGVPSELSEEDVKAFVVPAGDPPVDLAEIRGWAAQRLAAFKVPRFIEAVDELPHTPTGRVAKHSLSRERTEHEIDFDSADRRLSASMTEPTWRTSIGTSDADSITVQGRDMASELMGHVSFTELAFLLIRGRLPEPGEARLLDAVLVSLADHGLTPTVIAARMTLTGAPESLQGAVAAGLLGAGDVFLGVVENTARFLAGILEGVPEAADEDALRAAAAGAVNLLLDSGRRVPGLGHPIHKVQDPRTPRMYEIAEETGQLGRHLRLLELIAQAQRSATGRALPINGAGVAGAALADLGFDPAIVRGFALIARSAGLVGHIAEELAQPIGMELYGDVEDRTAYQPPPSD